MSMSHEDLRVSARSPSLAREPGVHELRRLGEPAASHRVNLALDNRGYNRGLNPDPPLPVAQGG